MHHHSSKECHISPCIVSYLDSPISKQFEISAQGWKFEIKRARERERERERNSSSCFCHQSCHSHQLKSQCHYVIFFLSILSRNWRWWWFHQIVIILVYSLSLELNQIILTTNFYLVAVHSYTLLACHLSPPWVKSINK